MYPFKVMISTHCNTLQHDLLLCFNQICTFKVMSSTITAPWIGFYTKRKNFLLRCWLVYLCATDLYIYSSDRSCIFRSLKPSTFAWFHIHMHLCVHLCERACVHICFVCVRVCTSAYIYGIYVCRRAHMCLCVTVYICILYICARAYVHIYIVFVSAYMHIYIYIYIFTRYHLRFLPLAQRLSKILKSLFIGILHSRLCSKPIFENFYVHRAK